MVLNRIHLTLFLCLIILVSCSKRSGNPKILVFSKTSGYYHESIPDGIAAIQKLGRENGIEVDTTTNSGLFTEENLRNYSAVVFLSTTGDVLNHYQEADFERYIQAGGGFVGIHAAADTEYDWGWYGRLTGGYFLDHPGINDPHPNVQEGVLEIEDHNHISTEFLPKEWTRTDEWYTYQKFNKEVNVLISLDEDSYQGGADTGFHPIAWYHEYDGGRAFYTGLGHTSESFKEELYLKHLLKGIEYAIGGNNKLEYNKAVTKRVPEEDRFTKTIMVLAEFTEPTEMTILPNLDIVIAQRRGEVLLYKNGDSTVRQLAHLDVYWKTDTKGVNAEEGLMGIKADPDFSKNGYIYMFYSPTDTSTNRLSRFKYENDQLDLNSEKMILEFYSQRDICCHTGGSIAFDKDGLLYVSTGDNSTPFNQPNQPYTNRGYAPLDERPGFEQYDAARSSGNTNDLRGKIIRIRVLDDGSYEIPEGNLYPVGMEGTRPEIYVQGNRNPYRISVDQKTGFVYWGEVGPDAAGDSLETRGPMGYDELNQARNAGFFGWPFFVGNNYPYLSYDYATGKSGQVFDPEKPVNLSRNNTGLKELPPVQPAFIWYPYGVSPDFPQVGTGGRNAMAGPVYYSDFFPKETRLPDYYDGKLFIYEWIRGWIKVVTMKPNGDFDKMEPFMGDTKFNSLIDLELGPDGKLYLLEYGSGWFTKNADAALSRIDFNPGNRAPRVENVTVNKTSGMLPFKVEIQAEASDPENDPLIYIWDLGNGHTEETNEPGFSYTYNETGEYNISVAVRDPDGLIAQSGVIEVYAGNVAPEVHIEINGNQSFYFPSKRIAYNVLVTDQNHPDASGDLSSLIVSADYLEGMDRAEASMGHLIMTEAMIGKSLVESLTCKACHQQNEKSVGPAYRSVAAKYEKDPQAESHLTNKIIQGGSGVWGETAMPANPELKQTDARKIISWILSLSGESENKNSLPPTGKVDPTGGKPVSERGVFVISASYTDKGGENIKPLTGYNSLVLQNPKLDLDKSTNLSGFSRYNADGRVILVAPGRTGHFSFTQIDLMDVSSIVFNVGSQKRLDIGYRIQVRTGGPDGELIGETTIKSNSEGNFPIIKKVGIDKVKESRLLDLYVSTSPLVEGSEETMAVLSMELKVD